MSKVLGLKKRIKSIANIGRITNTLYKVSLSYVSYWEQVIGNAKLYHQKLLSLLSPLKEELLMHLNELVNTKQNQDILVVWGPRQGLCGSLIPKLKEQISINLSTKEYKHIIVINHRLASVVTAMTKSENVEIIETGVISSATEANTLIDQLANKIKGYGVYKFDVIYPFYKGNLAFNINAEQVNLKEIVVSSLQQADLLQQNKGIDIDMPLIDMAQFVLDYYLYINLLVFTIHALTSENISRMVAMKNATDNTKDMLEKLQLEYNRHRQASITNELLDITNAKRAMEE